MVALSGLCGVPFIEKLAWVGLKYGGESALGLTLPGWSLISRSLRRANLFSRAAGERLPTLGYLSVDVRRTGAKDLSDP